MVSSIVGDTRAYIEIPAHLKVTRINKEVQLFHQIEDKCADVNCLEEVVVLKQANLC